MIKETPIMFSGEMVRSILKGNKSVTRRIMKNPPSDQVKWDEFGISALTPERSVEGRGRFKGILATDPDRYGSKFFKCPYGGIGDVLWVRETFQHTKILNLNQEDENYGYVYKADGQPWDDIEGWRWKPCIHMPKSASRIVLQITKIGIERLNEISPGQAIKEGIIQYTDESQQRWPTEIKQLKNHLNNIYKYLDPVTSFFSLWESINGKGSWQLNPYVWVIEFKKIEFYTFSEAVKNEH